MERIHPTILASMRVQLGTKELDAHDPLWHEKIEKPVNIASTKECVLAQLFNRFSEGLVALGITHEKAILCGFASSFRENNNDWAIFNGYQRTLSELWNKVVKKRKHNENM